MEINYRTYLNRFYLNIDWQIVTYIPENIYDVEHLEIRMLSVDFIDNLSLIKRKKVVEQWFEILPKLTQLKSLHIRYHIDDSQLEVISHLPNLENLMIECGKMSQLSVLSNLRKLNNLSFHTCSSLEDISGLKAIRNLKILGIYNCFKIYNFEEISFLEQLIALAINGCDISPRNLRLKSFVPFTNLRNLLQLDISYCSLIDQSYVYITELKKLERLDITITIPKEIRKEINEKLNLKAGNYVDFDWDKREFKNDRPGYFKLG